MERVWRHKFMELVLANFRTSKKKKQQKKKLVRLRFICM